MKTQEDILLSLIQGRAGYDFASGEVGWTRGSDACTWFGITCNDAGDVTGISLTGYALKATLPSDFSALSILEVLILTNCDLSGTIPPTVAQMTNLREVDLSLNHLTGALPSFVSQRLTIVSMAHNMFSGTMPSLGSTGRPHLITFNLKDNQITGTIPPFSGNFDSLRHIDVSQNRLEGRFIESLQSQPELPSLERLYLSDNNLSGTLPPTITDSLKELHCQNNQLTGTIPAAMARMADLQVLLLHNNRLTGEIPPDVCDLNLNAEYFAGGSSFGNEDDGINRWRRMESVYNGRDGCSSVACPAGFFSATGQYPCEPCEDQRMNPYLGAIECNHFSQEEILEIFYRDTSGDMWSDNSWGNPGVPVCSRTGITCDGDGSVVDLFLRNQGLSGTIPAEIGFLPNLMNLDVSHNFLTGHLPEELSLAPLESLTLSENYMSGYVPDSLCRKQGLNGNGRDDVFSCDIIACPMGTHHPQGHATPGNPCQPCPMVDGLVLANTDCRALSSRLRLSDSDDKIPEWGQIALVSFAGAFLLVLGFWVLRKIEVLPSRARIQQCAPDPKLKRTTDQTSLRSIT